MNGRGLAGFLCDALRPLGAVHSKRMFSGAGLFCDGLMFGLILRDTLYLKADAETQGAFEAEGQTPFVYEAKGRRVALGYWRAPERLLDDPDELVAWARTALGVAHRKARAKSQQGRAARQAAGDKRPAPARRGSSDPSRSARAPKRSIRNT